MTTSDIRIRMAWIIYGLVIIYITVLDSVGMIEIGSSAFMILIVCLYKITILVGVYCYVFNIAIFRSSVWRFIFWFTLILTGANTFSLLIRQSEELALIAAISIILMLPAFYALFRYSFDTHPVWSKPKD
mgnify:CR=1 FL=1